MKQHGNKLPSTWYILFLH